MLYTRPAEASRRIKHLDGHIHPTATTVVTNKEGRGGARRIIGHTDMAELRCQARSHFKTQFCRRRIVEYVPRPERKLVRAGREFGEIEEKRSFRIATKVESEIIVQPIRRCRVAVDDQFHIVTDARARHVNAVHILQLGHKQWCRIHLVAIFKLRRIEIAEQRGAYAVVHDGFRTAHHKVIAGAMTYQMPLRVDRIEIHQAGTRTVFHVFGHGKGQRETTRTHTVSTLEQGLDTILEHKRLINLTFFVHPTSNFFLRIAHHQVDNAFKLVLSLYMTDYPNDSSGLQNRLHVASDSHAVDGVDDHLTGGQMKSYGRIAQQRVLQLVDCRILSRFYHLYLGQPLCLSYRVITAFGLPQYVFNIGRVEHPIVGNVHCSGSSVESKGASIGIENGRLADGRYTPVKRHDIARSGNP